jgi:hypothetical protein
MQIPKACLNSIFKQLKKILMAWFQISSTIRNILADMRYQATHLRIHSKLKEKNQARHFKLLHSTTKIIIKIKLIVIQPKSNQVHHFSLSWSLEWLIIKIYRIMVVTTSHRLAKDLKEITLSEERTIKTLIWVVHCYHRLREQSWQMKTIFLRCG